MKQKKDLKAQRILYIFENLINSKVININELTLKFGVSEKTIQRDINDIREYTSPNNTIKYSRSKGGYILERESRKSLNASEIFSVLKVLLDSRGFNKSEMNRLIDGILNQLEEEERKKVNNLINNELYNFKPLKHNKNIISIIWEISDFIKNRNVIKIKYTKVGNHKVTRFIKPVGILFSEYYFYLIAYFEKGEFDSPTVFRIDRIDNYEVTDRKFYTPYSERFEEGEFRKRIQFMYSGELSKIRFEFYGKSIDSILDRLPTSRIISEDDKKYIIEAEVYGNGIIMWLLSQGSLIKVIGPDKLVTQIKEEINKLYNQYHQINIK